MLSSLELGSRIGEQRVQNQKKSILNLYNVPLESFYNVE